MKKQIQSAIMLVFLCSNIASAQFSWTQKQDVPDSRYEGVSFSAGGKVYYGIGENALAGVPDNKFYVLDPITNTWDTIAAFPGTLRRLASAFSIAGKGYVCFGVDPLTTLQLSDLWEYNPSSNAWIQKASLPPGNGWLAGTATSTNAKGYAGLGLHDHTTGTLNLTWWEYEPVGDTWTQKASMPGIGLYQTSSFAKGDSIYIVCGIGTNDLLPTQEVWLYNVALNTWNQQPDFPGNARASVAAFAISGKGYAGYGLGNSAVDLFNDFYSFVPSTGTWNAESSCGTALFDAACATSTAGYVISNTSWNSTSPDVWEFKTESTSDVVNVGNEFILNAYPDPVSNYLFISSNKSVTLHLFSIIGKKVQTISVMSGNENKVDISQLADGIYFLCDDNNEKFGIKRIIVRK